MSNLSIFPAALKPGVVQVTENDGTTKKIFVSSGTITVNEDASVQVLAEEAHPVENLDAAACRELFASAQSQAASASTDVVSKLYTIVACSVLTLFCRPQAKAEAAIALEVAEALVKAAE
jgi:F-type H+-transporting ATPase subunit delta